MELCFEKSAICRPPFIFTEKYELLGIEVIRIWEVKNFRGVHEKTCFGPISPRVCRKSKIPKKSIENSYMSYPIRIKSKFLAVRILGFENHQNPGYGTGGTPPKFHPSVATAKLQHRIYSIFN